MRVTWAILKAQADAKSICPQYVDINDAYWIKLIDGPFELDTVINKDDGADADLIEFEADYKPKSNKKIDARTGTSDIPKVAVYKAQGSSFIKVTHDFTDKTTWWQTSVKATDITMTLKSGDIYETPDDNWIDAIHGKIYMEDDITMDGTPMVFGGTRKYAVILKDDGVVITEDTDFTVDYVNGEITLDAGYSLVGSLTITYYHSGVSTFTLAPDVNKMIHLQHSELQFTLDMNMDVPVYFDLYVYNPADLPNKVLFKRTIYKNLKDIINASNLGTGVIKASDVFTQDVSVLPFAYATEITLQSSVGAELRVSTKGDVPFSGSWGTATFYIVSQDEG